MAVENSFTSLHEFVRLEDLKRTLKVLEEKYIKGGETDEGLRA